MTFTPEQIERAIGELDATMFTGPFPATPEACRDHMRAVLEAAGPDPRVEAMAKALEPFAHTGDALKEPPPDHPAAQTVNEFRAASLALSAYRGEKTLEG